MIAPLIAATLLLGQSVPKPAGLLDGSKLKADFNAAKGSVRLMFIWAPS